MKCAIVRVFPAPLAIAVAAITSRGAPTRLSLAHRTTAQERRDHEPALAHAGSFFYGSGSHYNASLAGRPFNKPGTNRLNISAPIVIPEAMLDRWEGPAVIGTNEVAAERASGLAAAQGGHPPLALDQGGRHDADADGRGVRPVQLEELRQLHSTSFGQPTASSGNAYAPRSGQLGFRYEF